jgi:hypothetical protein
LDELRIEPRRLTSSRKLGYAPRFAIEDELVKGEDDGTR